MPALCSTGAEAGQSSKLHSCSRKGKPTASIQRGHHLVSTILCLHSDFCVPLFFPCFSSKSWSSSNTRRYCCALSGMQLAWLASFCQLAREHLHFQAITRSDFTERTSITQHYSIALIIIQILFSGSFASSQARTGAWLALHHKFPLLFTTESRVVISETLGIPPAVQSFKPVGKSRAIDFISAAGNLERTISRGL